MCYRRWKELERIIFFSKCRDKKSAVIRIFAQCIINFDLIYWLWPFVVMASIGRGKILSLQLFNYLNRFYALVM